MSERLFVPKRHEPREQVRLAQRAEPQQLSLTSGNVGLAALGSIVGIMSVGLGALGQPHLLTRFMALRDEKALAQARAIALVWFLLVFLGMFLLGLCAHILLPPTGNPEGLFFEATRALFPPVLAGIAVAAVLSAVMSTADSQLLVTASAISHDLGVAKRYPQHALGASRAVIFIVSILAILTALWVPAAIFDRVLFAWVALGAAFGPTVVMRALGVQVRPEAVLAAIIVGFSLAVGLSLAPSTPGDIAERLTPLVTGFAILLLGRTRSLPR